MLCRNRSHACVFFSWYGPQCSVPLMFLHSPGRHSRSPCFVCVCGRLLFFRPAQALGAAPLALAASGRTASGGLLHPAAWSGPVRAGAEGGVLGPANAERWHYAAVCALVPAAPAASLGGAPLELAECLPGAGDSGAAQRFKFGYDWTGDWVSAAGVAADELWANAPAQAREAVGVGEGGGGPEVWALDLTVVLAWDPVYCLDACPKGHDKAGGGWDGCGAGAWLNACDGDLPFRRSQRWAFRPWRGARAESGEVVSAGALDAGLDAACLGWGAVAGAGAALGLFPCDGTYLWDAEFFMETAAAEPVHGAFFFDPYRNYRARGNVTVSPFGDLRDYTVWDTSVLSVVVAGNSSLSIMTEACPVEGCATFSAGEAGAGPGAFRWSDGAAWLRRNASVPCDHEPFLAHDDALCSHERPCGCGDVTIQEGWVVTLDVTTPFLNTLTIKGTLLVPWDHPEALAIHAQIIDIKGGRLMAGNETHPFQGPLFQIVLHGDMYLHGKECTNPIDESVTKFGCWKQMVVSGELSLRGATVPIVTRRLGADAWAGARTLVLDGPVGAGWVAGAEVAVSGGGAPEHYTIAGVAHSSGRASVTLAEPLARSKIGERAEVASAGLNASLDGRATVSLLSRNVEVRGGFEPAYDYLSGVGPDLTDYGATVRLWAAYSEPKPGWQSDMVGYSLYGQNLYPAGSIASLKYVRFRHCGKQFGPIKPGLKREAPLNLHSGVPALDLVGVVVTEPLAGHFFECSGVGPYKGAYAGCAVGGTALTVREGVFVGSSMTFDPFAGVTHTVHHNVWLGGIHCRIGCPDAKMVVFGNDDPITAGALRVTNNSAYNGYGGFTIKAPCGVFETEAGGAWAGNVAMGNAVGFDIAAGARPRRGLK